MATFVKCFRSHENKTKLWSSGKNYEIIAITPSIRKGDYWYSIATNIKGCYKDILKEGSREFLSTCIEWKGHGHHEYFASFQIPQPEISL